MACAASASACSNTVLPEPGTPVTATLPAAPSNADSTDLVSRTGPSGAGDRHRLAEQPDIRSAQGTEAVDVTAQARDGPQYDALCVQDLDQAVTVQVRAFLGKPLPLSCQRPPQGLGSGNVTREIAQHHPYRGGVVLAVLGDGKRPDR